MAKLEDAALSQRANAPQHELQRLLDADVTSIGQSVVQRIGLIQLCADVGLSLCALEGG